MEPQDHLKSVLTGSEHLNPVLTGLEHHKSVRTGLEHFKPEIQRLENLTKVNNRLEIFIAVATGNTDYNNQTRFCETKKNIIINLIK